MVVPFALPVPIRSRPTAQRPTAPRVSWGGRVQPLMPTKLSLVAMPRRAIVQLAQNTLSTPERIAPLSSAPGIIWA